MLPDPIIDDLELEVTRLVQSRISGTKEDNLPIIRYDRYSTHELQEYLEATSRSVISALVSKRNKLKSFSAKDQLYQIQIRIEKKQFQWANEISRVWKSSDNGFIQELGKIPELEFIRQELEDPARQFEPMTLWEYDQDTVLLKLFEGIQRSRESCV